MNLKAITITLMVILASTTGSYARNPENRGYLSIQDKASKRAQYAQNTNILRISPLTAMDIGVGFGISYEKIFGPEKTLGFVIPVYLLLNNDYNTNKPETYVFFAPGLKVYPFGQRKVTYAIGPSLMFGYGGGTRETVDYLSGISYSERITRLRIGMLVNNYVNFNITPNINLGLEAGLGVRYVDKQTVEDLNLNIKNNYYNGLDVTGLFSMTFGFRF